MDRHLLSPPPRKVSLSLKIRLLFSGLLIKTGCAIFLFGLLFCWAFSVGDTFSELYHFSGELIATEGISTGYSRTNTSINDEDVFKTSYNFQGIDGKAYSGVSYRTGDYVPRGVKLPVEFNPDNAKYSRIEGARYSVMGAGGLFILILPLTGILIASISLYFGFKKVKILKVGLPAVGTLISKSRTGTEVNEQPVYKMVFQYRSTNGTTHETSTKTLTPELLEDESQESLIYDPANPAKSVFTDTLPGEVAVDNNGNFYSRSGFLGALTSLILPVLGVLIFIKIFFL